VKLTVQTKNSSTLNALTAFPQMYRHYITCEGCPVCAAVEANFEVADVAKLRLKEEGDGSQHARSVACTARG